MNATALEERIKVAAKEKGPTNSRMKALQGLLRAPHAYPGIVPAKARASRSNGRRIG